MKKKTYFAVAVSLVCAILFAQGCSRDHDGPEKTKESSVTHEMPFLDMEIHDNEDFTEEQLAIMVEAFDRICVNFLVIKTDTCYLTTHSAQDAHMSERLFALMEKMIHYTNEKYQMYVLCKEKYPELQIENPFKNARPNCR